MKMKFALRFFIFLIHTPVVALYYSIYYTLYTTLYRCLSNCWPSMIYSKLQNKFLYINILGFLFDFCFFLIDTCFRHFLLEFFLSRFTCCFEHFVTFLLIIQNKIAHYFDAFQLLSQWYHFFWGEEGICPCLLLKAAQ